MFVYILRLPGTVCSHNCDERNHEAVRHVAILQPFRHRHTRLSLRVARQLRADVTPLLRHKPQFPIRAAQTVPLVNKRSEQTEHALKSARSSC